MSIQGPPPSIMRFWRPWIVAFLQRVIAAWQPGLVPTSFWRSAAENARVGGHKESQHQLALALDVTGPVEALDRFARVAEASGLRVIRRPRYIHLQMFDAGYLASVGVRFPA